jgi:hypothetical protein
MQAHSIRLAGKVPSPQEALIARDPSLKPRCVFLVFMDKIGFIIDYPLARRHDWRQWWQNISKYSKIILAIPAFSRYCYPIK